MTTATGQVEGTARGREGSAVRGGSAPLWLYGVLDIPYGIITTGLVTTSMSFLLRRSGMGVGEIGSTLALLQMPITFYYTYGLLTDFFMRRKVWAALSGCLAGVCGAAGVWTLDAHRTRAVMLMFIASAVATMVSAASGGMMASLLTKREKADVGAWIQGGNLGAGSLVGGLVLWLAATHGNFLLGWIFLVACVPPALMALRVKEPHREKSAEKLKTTFAGLGKEIKLTFFRWEVLPGLLMLLSPTGTGAMQQLMGGVTKEYGASAMQLAFANGWGGGILTAAGSLAALLWPVKWNRMLPYAGSALVYAMVTGAVALAPMKPMTLILGLLASNFVTGLAYGCYTGLLLQTMGEGGKRQSTRYTLLNALGNWPVVYMVWICGQVGARFEGTLGPRSIAGADAALNLLTVVVFAVWWWMWGRKMERDVVVA